MKYYNLDNILKYNSQYYLIFGERSKGKSYALGKYVIDEYFKNKKEFVLVKRYKEDISSNAIGTWFEHLQDYAIEKYGKKIRFYQSKFYFVDDENTTIKDSLLFGYVQALTKVDRYKGGQFPNVNTIVFEEFMSMDCYYLPDEVNKLINLVSTITRNRKDTKVFLLGNAISKYSPYWEALDIQPNKIKKGEIVYKEFKVDKLKTSFTIERTGSVKYDTKNRKIEESTFSVFGKNNNNMIEKGDFESKHYNRIIGNVTFNELKRKEDNNPMIFNKGDKIPIVLEFNKEFYSFYLKYNGVMKVLGVRKCDKVSNKTIAIINPSKHYGNWVEIYNISYCKAKLISRYLDIIAECYYNKWIVYFNDEVGTDVETCFKLCGLI